MNELEFFILNEEISNTSHKSIIQFTKYMPSVVLTTKKGVEKSFGGWVIYNENRSLQHDYQ